MILDRRGEKRPVVIVGDIHGSFHTLTEHLLPALGFDPEGNHPEGVRLVSVGDLHDRAGLYAAQTGNPSDSGAVNVIRWAMKWVENNNLDVVDSNHGKKLARKLLTGERAGRDGEPFGHGLDDTLIDLELQPDKDLLIPKVQEFLATRPSLGIYNGGPTGTLVVAHAAANPAFLTLEKLNRRERDYCIYPREFIWKGSETVVVGHVVTEGVVRERYTRSDGSKAGEIIRIDTGAFDGGGLTAYLPDTDTSVTVATDPRDLPDDERRYRNRFTG